MTVMFGDTVAPATFYGPQSILATAPPSRPGGVNVTLVPPQGQPTQGNMYTQPTAGRAVFLYTDRNPQVMEMALRNVAHQQQYDPAQWPEVTQGLADQWGQYMQSRG